MSDNLKRYCAIHSALLATVSDRANRQFSPASADVRRSGLRTFAALVCGRSPLWSADVRRSGLRTFAALVCGIIGSKKVHLPAVAGKSPNNSKRESRAKRFARFLQNKSVTPSQYFAPFAQALLSSLPAGPLVLIMDGSQVGRGCMALMVSVLYQNRALPLCWQVTKAPKGHFAQDAHRELLAQAKALVPPERPVIFLGDGEFDGPNLLADVRAAGWHFVCRTAKNVRLAEEDWPKKIGRRRPSRFRNSWPKAPCIQATVWNLPSICSPSKALARCWWAQFGIRGTKSRFF